MFKNLKEKISDSSLKTRPVPATNLDQKTKTTETEVKNELKVESSFDTTTTTNAPFSIELEQKEKIKRLEELLSKCKHTIQSLKEKIHILSNDKNDLMQQIELKTKEIDDVKNEKTELNKTLEGRISSLEQCLEVAESKRVMDVANVKQEMHGLLEEKEQEVIRGMHVAKELAEEKELMQAELLVIKHQSKESNDEVAKLRLRITTLEQEASEKVQATEERMEKEKLDELHELRRGKVEALQLMQASRKQMSDRISELQKEKEEALLERDKLWEGKWNERKSSQEKEHMSEMMREQEEMALAAEEQELQRKMIVNQLQHEVTSLQNDLSILSKENEELKLKLLSTGDELKDVVTKLTIKQNELTSQHEVALSNLRMQQQADIDSLTKRHMNAFEKLKVDSAFKLQSVIIAKDKKFEEFSTELNERLTVQIEELNSTACSRMLALQDKIEKLSMKNESIKLQYEELKGKNEAINVEARKKMESEICALSEANLLLKDDIQKLKKEHNKQNVEHLSEILELRELNEKLSTVEQQLRSQLNSTEEKLTSELDRVTSESSLTLSQFKDMLDASQHDMKELLDELIFTKNSSQSTIDALKYELEQKNSKLKRVMKQLKSVSDGDALEKDIEAGDDLIDGGDHCDIVRNSNENNAVKIEADNANESKLGDEVGSCSVANMSYSESMVLKEKMKELDRSNEQLHEAKNEIIKLKQLLSDKESDFEELNHKFWQLSQEAKKKITEMKLQLDEKNKVNDNACIAENKEAVDNYASICNILNSPPNESSEQNKNSVTTSSLQQVTRPASPQPPSSSSSSYNEMEFQLQELKLKHADEIDKLNEEIRKSRQEVQFFKESFRSQFDEAQLKMKLVMEKMRENHESILQERDNLLDIKLDNLKKEKDIERNREVRKLNEMHNKVLQEKNEKLQEFEAQICTLTSQLQHLKDKQTDPPPATHTSPNDDTTTNNEVAANHITPASDDVVMTSSDDVISTSEMIVNSETNVIIVDNNDDDNINNNNSNNCNLIVNSNDINIDVVESAGQHDLKMSPVGQYDSNIGNPNIMLDVTKHKNSYNNNNSKTFRNVSSINNNSSDDKDVGNIINRTPIVSFDVGIQVELDTKPSTTSSPTITTATTPTLPTTTMLSHISTNYIHHEPAILVPSSQTANHVSENNDTNQNNCNSISLLNDLSHLEEKHDCNKNYNNSLDDSLADIIDNFDEIVGNKSPTNCSDKNNRSSCNASSNKFSKFRNQERLLSFNDESLIDVEVSDANNTDNESLLEAYSALNIQPTELETLTKVICTVMRFTEDEKKQIMESQQSIKTKASVSCSLVHFIFIASM
ncbi:hypothetical protein HELRODRAFT_162502 [Helobdella robusta]|uniref:GRIP domain-containing protein n=1 Tax=Helobdella robusta TaxID=6412 RepID=T1ESR4_HELRO|nr:hypothetical protein HELRODRAFT_162502 [Helobdella robusta]ESN99023.1 hypothetical protein HELRODRAFT_162502 [Helobdella robusta]